MGVAMQVCMKDGRLGFLWDLPPGLKSVVHRCRDRDPEARPTFAELYGLLQRVLKNLKAGNLKRQNSDRILETTLRLKELDEKMMRELTNDDYADSDARDEEAFHK